MCNHNLHLDMKQIRILFITNYKDDKSIKDPMPSEVISECLTPPDSVANRCLLKHKLSVHMPCPHYLFSLTKPC